jgi:hypothetical protein
LALPSRSRRSGRQHDVRTTSPDIRAGPAAGFICRRTAARSRAVALDCFVLVPDWRNSCCEEPAWPGRADLSLPGPFRSVSSPIAGGHAPYRAFRRPSNAQVDRHTPAPPPTPGAGGKATPPKRILSSLIGSHPEVRLHRPPEHLPRQTRHSAGFPEGCRRGSPRKVRPVPSTRACPSIGWSVASSDRPLGIKVDQSPSDILVADLLSRDWPRALVETDR